MSDMGKKPIKITETILRDAQLFSEYKSHHFEIMNREE